MWYAVYEVWKRFWGYWVPTICEHPNCNKEINRGMDYACWWEPFSEYWCDRYFCEEHTKYVSFDAVEWWIVTDDKYKSKEVCFRCAEWKEPFPYKPESKEWIRHVLKDESWEKWREKNPKKVESYIEILNK